MSHSDSPYDEHEDERRPCESCGGTHTMAVVSEARAGEWVPCPLCGPPSEPDPLRQAKGLRDTAAMLRGRAYRTRDKRERRICEEDALWHERRADELERAGSVQAGGVEGHAAQRGKAEGAADAATPQVTRSALVDAGKSAGVRASQAMTTHLEDTNGKPKHPAGIKPGAACTEPTPEEDA